MPSILRPRALRAGDEVAIAALSGPLEAADLELYERGHEPPNIPLPLGVRAAIDADGLTISLEPAVAEL